MPLELFLFSCVSIAVGLAIKTFRIRLVKCEERGVAELANGHPSVNLYPQAGSILLSQEP